MDVALPSMVTLTARRLSATPEFFVVRKAVGRVNRAKYQVSVRCLEALLLAVLRVTVSFP